MEEENKIIEEEKEEKKEEPARGRGKKKRGIGSIISSIITTIIVIAILFFVAMGLLGLKNVNEGKEPVWYVNKNTEKIDKTDKTTYDLILFEIINEKSDTQKKVTLRPFFMKYFENKEEKK